MKDYEYREINAGTGTGVLKIAVPVAIFLGLVIWYLAH